MSTSASWHGVWPAALTPFDARLGIDVPRLAAHCRRLIAAGCRGVSLFGTTGEGTAMSAEERMAGLEAVIAAGVPADRLMPATGVTDVPTTVALSIHAARLDVAGVLALPTFYLKDASQEGIYRHFAAVIEKLGATPGLRLPKLCFYNFPFHTGITLAPALVRRLADAFPNVVAGIKDSSGDWDLSQAYLNALPDLAVFVGDERTILRARAKGGAGSISGMANAVAPTLVELCATPVERAERLQKIVDAAVGAVLAHPFVPAMKAVLAELDRVPSWNHVRSPLEAASAPVGPAVLAQLKAAGAALIGG